MILAVPGRPTTPERVSNMSETYTSRGTPTHKGLALLVLGISQLMIILDGTIVNIALVPIASALDISSFTDLQWIVTGYALTFGGFLLLGGKLADRIGRRRIFIAGLFLFGFASLLGGLANSLGLLIAARALQGVGGAMLAPAALSLLTVVFAEGKERDRAFGVWAGISAGGAALGLILGGVLTEYVGWRWVFYVNVPIALFAIWGTLRFVPESRDASAKGFDVFGALLITVGLAALVFGLTNLDSDTITSGTKAIVLVAAAVLIVGFFVWEGVIKQPLLPLRLFKFRNLTGSNIGGLLVGAGLFSVFLYLVFWMQDINHWSPLKSGFAFLPFTVGIIIGAAISSTQISRFGARPFVTIGPLLAAAGMLALGLFLEPDASYVGLILPAQLVISIGLGLTFPALIGGAVAGVPTENAGIASALLNAAQQVGGAVGLALLTAVSANRFNSLTAEMAANGTLPVIDPAAVAAQAAAAGVTDPIEIGLAIRGATIDALAVPTVDGWATALVVGAALIGAAGVIMFLIVRGGKGPMPKMVG